MNTVYFIQSYDTNHIKIGFTTNLKKRMYSIKTNSSSKIILLGYVFGDLSYEKLLHEQFKFQRVKGEWFYCTQELIDFINSVNVLSYHIELLPDNSTIQYCKMKYRGV